MDRRDLLLRSAALLAIPEIGWAKPDESVKPLDGMKPYVQVEPLKEDLEVVRVYFTPECTFSRSYLPFFSNLKKTLPPNRKFVYSDVVNHRDGAVYALASATVRKVFPNYVNNFVEASMIAVQDKGLPVRSWQVIDQIGKAAQIPMPLSRAVWEQKQLMQAEVIEAVRMQNHYKISNTPSVAVAGTYVVNPEIAMGDMEMFSNLLNAVISMTQ